MIRKSIAKIVKMKHGPAALAVLGGALVGLGMHNADQGGADYATDLQASAFNETEVLDLAQSVLEKTETKKPIPSKIADEILPEDVIFHVPTQATPLEKMMASDEILPEDLREKLNMVRSQYENQYNEVRLAQQQIDKIEDLLVQKKLDDSFDLSLDQVSSILTELEIVEEEVADEGLDKTFEILDLYDPEVESVKFVDQIPRG